MPLFHKTALHPGYIASRRIPLALSNGANAVAAVNTVYLFPFTLEATLPFASLSAFTGTGGTGSSMKTAIWANSPVSIRPLGAPLYKDDTGVATTASTTSLVITTGAGVLAPGTYWAGTKHTGTLPQLWAQPNSYLQMAMISGVSGAANNLPFISFADAYANAMPTFSEGASFTAHNSATPILWAVT